MGPNINDLANFFFPLVLDLNNFFSVYKIILF